MWSLGGDRSRSYLGRNLRAYRRVGLARKVGSRSAMSKRCGRKSADAVVPIFVSQAKREGLTISYKERTTHDLDSSDTATTRSRLSRCMVIRGLAPGTDYLFQSLVALALRLLGGRQDSPNARAILSHGPAQKQSNKAFRLGAIQKSTHQPPLHR